MVPPRSPSELRAIADWRKAVLDRALWVCFAILSVGIVLGLSKPPPFQGKILLIAILPGWLLVSAAAFWPRAPLGFRQVTLVAGLLIASLGSIAKLGFLAVNGFCAHLMLVVMVALFMGRRAAWGVWMVGVVSLAVIALSSAGEGAVGGGGAPYFDVRSLANWLRVVGVYAAISGITLASVSYLATRMEGALSRSEALYAALTEESTRRIAALEEQRKLEEKLRQSQKMEALGTLAGGVAHDFNNLLLVIMNQAELAAEAAQSETAREALEQVLGASERAAGLTRQLLAFGRRQVTQRAALDVNGRLEESLRMLRRLLPTSIELALDLQASAATVRIAGVELDQLLMNLCVNARDAMPDGGRLTIRSSNVQSKKPGDTQEAAYVRLRIEDSGCGMDGATQERMFEPFFTTKAPGHGTGLGLSTVHGLVQQVGGFIEVHSSPGQGTALSVYLPQFFGEPQTASQYSFLPPRRGHETLLVADDDPEVRAILQRRLQDHGYRVLVCSDGEEALTTFRKHASEIALVVSDAVMPKLGGRELHRALCAEFGEIPFLICSGYAAQTLEADFFDHPLRAFLAKPFNDHALQTQVRSLLDARARLGTKAAAAHPLGAPWTKSST